MSKILSSEIVSLVHHVKLNESGWWEKTVQNIIISVFGAHDNSPKSQSDILELVKSEINSGLENSRIIRELEKLKSQKRIVQIDSELNILSDEEYERYKESFANQREIEFEAEKRFNDLCFSICPELNCKSLWTDLNESLIIPLIKEIGAKTYELISGQDKITIEQYSQFSDFIARYKDDKTRIHGLLLNYFDFKNDFVRRYVLHQLNAYFFVEATNLNQNTVEEVYTLSRSQIELKVFVDTNFLLTLLDLHDNPSNDAAFSLLELLEEVQNRVKIKFYILPVTIHEFQNLIRKFKDYLKRLKPSLNQAIAAEGTEEFSGIIKKFFQKCHEMNTMLNVDDYFDPYLENFTVNIRKKGLEIQQDNMDKYSTDQRVVDDLLEQVEYRYQKNLNAGKYNNLNEDEKES